MKQRLVGSASLPLPTVSAILANEDGKEGEESDTTYISYHLDSFAMGWGSVVYNLRWGIG